MNEKMKFYLRWFCVLPAAIIAFLIIQCLLVLGAFIWPTNQIFLDFISSIWCPVCFVLAGAFTAPVYRFITSLVLTILVAIMGSVVVTWTIARGPGWNGHAVWLIITCLIMVAAALTTSMWVHKEERETIEARLQSLKYQ